MIVLNIIICSSALCLLGVVCTYFPLTIVEITSDLLNKIENLRYRTRSKQVIGHLLFLSIAFTTYSSYQTSIKDGLDEYIIITLGVLTILFILYSITFHIILEKNLKLFTKTSNQIKQNNVINSPLLKYKNERNDLLTPLTKNSSTSTSDNRDYNSVNSNFIFLIQNNFQINNYFFSQRIQKIKKDSNHKKAKAKSFSNPLKNDNCRIRFNSTLQKNNNIKSSQKQLIIELLQSQIEPNSSLSAVRILDRLTNHDILDNSYNWIGFKFPYAETKVFSMLYKVLHHKKIIKAKRNRQALLKIFKLMYSSGDICYNTFTTNINNFKNIENDDQAKEEDQFVYDELVSILTFS